MNLLFVRSLLYAVAMAILPMPIQAATLSVKLQQQVRAATFEVVISKANKDPLSYEKPLPMELVPFAERNDRYWSRQVMSFPLVQAASWVPPRYVMAMARSI